ncbi:MAG: helix-turn-helix domain-containing protein [Proteobacteria bacterium]|nr:helix-turn-helix domain-containing protein [Pseudomonadota bacterium]
MEKGFLTIEEVSQYLSVKISTLYARVSEIPHYKVGSLLRFKKEDIDAWMESKRQPSVKTIARTNRKETNHRKLNEQEKGGITSIVRKAIDEAHGKGYNFAGKSDHVKGLRKGGK